MVVKYLKRLLELKGAASDAETFKSGNVWLFGSLCTVVKFKITEFLLDDKNATYLSS
jgi:hypothetical protein